MDANGHGYLNDWDMAKSVSALQGLHCHLVCIYHHFTNRVFTLIPTIHRALGGLCRPSFFEIQRKPTN